MAKVVRYVKDKQTEFVKAMDKLTRSRQSWEVWSDFVTMFAIALSNSVDKVHFKKREELYLKIINKYNKQEQQVFPELAGIVILAYEQDRAQDFLGELYMSLNLGNHWKGQYFTPYHLCEAMSRMSAGNIVEQVNKEGYISVLDCCCGAGALLVAFANVAEHQLSKENINFQNHILFVAQDVDMVVGMMCYIQLSLLGCAGYLKIGNSLTEPITKGEAEANLWIEDSTYWYTPMYFSDVWQWRRLFQEVDRLTRFSTDKENNKITVSTETQDSDAIPETAEFEIKLNENGQYSLL